MRVKNAPPSVPTTKDIASSASSSPREPATLKPNSTNAPDAPRVSFETTERTAFLESSAAIETAALSLEHTREQAARFAARIKTLILGKNEAPLTHADVERFHARLVQTRKDLEHATRRVTSLRRSLSLLDTAHLAEKAVALTREYHEDARTWSVLSASRAESFDQSSNEPVFRDAKTFWRKHEDPKFKMLMPKLLSAIGKLHDAAADFLAQTGHVPLKWPFTPPASSTDLETGAFGNPKLSGQFVPVQEAKEIAKRTYELFQEICAARPDMTEAQGERSFLALLKLEMERKGLGGLVCLDVGCFDFLPTHLAQKITHDHHGVYFDAKNPEVNTTMLLLDEIERVKKGPGTDDEKIAKLKRHYTFVTTDNLGDGIWAMFVAQNIEAFVKNGGLPCVNEQGREVILTIDKLCTLAHFEDFGIFGTSYIDKAAKAEDAKPGELSLRELIHIQLAIFRHYDRILAEHGIVTGDRFGEQGKDVQELVVQKALSGISRSLSDKEHRLEYATEFKTEAKGLVDRVKDAHVAFKNRLRENESTQNVAERLDQKVFYFEDRLSGGRFARWDAPSLAHELPIQLGFSDLGKDEQGRALTGFVLSVPNGRSAKDLVPGGSLKTAFLETLETKNREKAAALGSKLEDKPRILGRDELLFVFSPTSALLLSPTEILEVLASKL